MWRKAAWFIGGSLFLYGCLVIMDRVAFLRWDPVDAAYRVLSSHKEAGDGVE